jgi:hypothetical protein
VIYSYLGYRGLFRTFLITQEARILLKLVFGVLWYLKHIKCLTETFCYQSVCWQNHWHNFQLQEFPHFCFSFSCFLFIYVYIYDLYIYIYKFPEPWKPVSKETRLRAGRLVSNSFQVI